MKSQVQATKIYAAHVAGLNAMFERLHASVGDDLFSDPAKVTWPQVEAITQLTRTVRDICDMTFHEGKYSTH
jgi:mannose/cellobiose epimerase-like protein (N-acyl-D-glucosamine 2-epimerase family)